MMYYCHPDCIQVDTRSCVEVFGIYLAVET